jgi:alkanesulfonate monooxygenase SsuD/methylene tetrahydromethanopterin reductase-like flavin-dependent oxidoreductase (luciferase family)
MSGRVTLPSGRDVINTGRVLIGLRAGERPDSARVLSFARRADTSRDAERIQTALLKPGEVRHHGHMRPDPRTRLRALPKPIELDNSLAARIARGRAHLYLLCALALANAFGRLKD